MSAVSNAGSGDDEMERLRREGALRRMTPEARRLAAAFEEERAKGAWGGDSAQGWKAFLADRAAYDPAAAALWGEREKKPSHGEVLRGVGAEFRAFRQEGRDTAARLVQASVASGKVLTEEERAGWLNRLRGEAMRQPGQAWVQFLQARCLEDPGVDEAFRAVRGKIDAILDKQGRDAWEQVQGMTDYAAQARRIRELNEPLVAMAKTDFQERYYGTQDNAERERLRVASQRLSLPAHQRDALVQVGALDYMLEEIRVSDLREDMRRVRDVFAKSPETWGEKWETNAEAFKPAA